MNLTYIEHWQLCYTSWPLNPRLISERCGNSPDNLIDADDNGVVTAGNQSLTNVHHNIDPEQFAIFRYHAHCHHTSHLMSWSDHWVETNHYNLQFMWKKKTRIPQMKRNGKIKLRCGLPTSLKQRINGWNIPYVRGGIEVTKVKNLNFRVKLLQTRLLYIDTKDCGFCCFCTDAQLSWEKGNSREITYVLVVVYCHKNHQDKVKRDLKDEATGGRLTLDVLFPRFAQVFRVKHGIPGLSEDLVVCQPQVMFTSVRIREVRGPINNRVLSKHGNS